MAPTILQFIVFKRLELFKKTFKTFSELTVYWYILKTLNSENDNLNSFEVLSFFKFLLFDRGRGVLTRDIFCSDWLFGSK